jgi:hypothetical protein
VNVENVNVQPGIVNVYRSREDWQQLISQYFRAVTKRHLFSKLVESYAGDGIKVQFYKDQMVVIARRDDHLQLARSFELSADEDAVYHLLNVCKQTGINPAEIPIYVSGFIEENSAAFGYISKYFDVVVMDNASILLLQRNNPGPYPDQYFAPFFNLLQ